MSFRTAYHSLSRRTSYTPKLIRDLTPEQEKRQELEYYQRMQTAKYNSNGRK